MRVNPSSANFPADFSVLSVRLDPLGINRSLEVGRIREMTVVPVFTGNNSASSRAARVQEYIEGATRLHKVWNRSLGQRFVPILIWRGSLVASNSTAGLGDPATCEMT